MLLTTYYLLLTTRHAPRTTHHAPRTTHHSPSHGQAHPVWWDEGVKWKVLLGQSIQGEVRIRTGGRGARPDAGREGLRLVEGMGGAASGGDDVPSSSSKLERLREIAEGYDCSMNLYSNNCRVFCARMRREAVAQHGQGAAWAAPQHGSCASSGRAARHSQGEAGPPGDRQTDRQTDRQAGRQAGRQTIW